MKRANREVSEYLGKVQQWRKELCKLREIALDCQLTEEFKWGQPCYTYQQSNVAILSPFKRYCILAFFKGVLLDDPNGILTAPGENSQASRQVCFTSIQEILDMEPVLKQYIANAIQIEISGLKVDFKKERAPIPEEFQSNLDRSTALKKAFDALTPGRQRGYLLYFSAAKGPDARKRRIEKYIERILDGKGINDCICGLSRRMPICDGSHKALQSS